MSTLQIKQLECFVVQTTHTPIRMKTGRLALPLGISTASATILGGKLNGSGLQLPLNKTYIPVEMCFIIYHFQDDLIKYTCLTFF